MNDISCTVCGRGRHPIARAPQQVDIAQYVDDAARRQHIAQTGQAEPVHHPALREQARQSIRPTRTDPGGAKPEADERDADARRDDTDLDDAVESPADLLARHLDAEIITEDESPT